MAKASGALEAKIILLHSALQRLLDATRNHQSDLAGEQANAEKVLDSSYDPQPEPNWLSRHYSLGWQPNLHDIAHNLESSGVKPKSDGEAAALSDARLALHWGATEIAELQIEIKALKDQSPF